MDSRSPDTKARGLHRKEQQLLQKWFQSIVEYGVAHQRASEYFELVSMLLLGSMMILPLLANTCSQWDVIADWRYGPVISIACTMLAAAATAAEGRTNPAHRAKLHHHAHLKWRDLECRIRAMFAHTEVRGVGRSIAGFRQQYDALLAESPIVPFATMRSVVASYKPTNLSVTESPLPEVNHTEPEHFTADEEANLEKRVMLAKENRKQTLIVAERWHRVASVLETLVAIAAVLSSSLALMMYCKDAPWWCRYFRECSNYCLSVTSFVEGKNGFKTKVEMMKELSCKWSNLSREIDEALWCQPHANIHWLAAHLDDKYQTLVTEVIINKNPFVSSHDLEKANASTSSGCCAMFSCGRSTLPAAEAEYRVILNTKMDFIKASLP